MKISEVKNVLQQVTELTFTLPNGTKVPSHFHVTEVGVITKHFIDCGGTVRNEQVVNFQLWEANDFDHRLAPKKLADIIDLSERVLRLPDAEVEVEYQADTIGKYGLYFNALSGNFELTSKTTNCLAQDKCGIPPEKLKRNLADLTVVAAADNCCTPGGGCC
jgi:hypothetical protein